MSNLQLFTGGPQRDDDGAILDDAHYTPDRCAIACLGDLVPRMRRRRGLRWVEGSIGGGAFGRGVRRFDDDAFLVGADIHREAAGLDLCTVAHPGVDFLHLDIPEADAVVGNPPFGGPDEKRGRRPGDPKYVGAHHVLRALELAPVVGMILPLEWQGVGYVNDVIFGPRPPAYFRVLTPRPWTVVRACAWYVWLPRDERFMNRGVLNWKA